MGGQVVTFYPTRLFWTGLTKIVYSSGVPDLNLGILTTYLPEVLSQGVLWHKASLYLVGSSSSFSGLARGMTGLTNLL